MERPVSAMTNQNRGQSWAIVGNPKVRHSRTKLWFCPRSHDCPPISGLLPYSPRVEELTKNTRRSWAIVGNWLLISTTAATPATVCVPLRAGNTPRDDVRQGAPAGCVQTCPVDAYGHCDDACGDAGRNVTASSTTPDATGGCPRRPPLPPASGLGSSPDFGDEQWGASSHVFEQVRQ